MGLFKRSQRLLVRAERGSSGVELPAGYATGDPDDDEILRHIALRGPLEKPRHWVHFLLCQNIAAVRAVAAAALDAGWTIEIRADSKRKDVCVTAEQSDVVTTGERVRSARLFFEKLADRTPGVQYDGWHASV